ncbi:MAG: DUF2207 domain-containing protein [Roseibium sp.]|uniref:DUF2207 domain-containing protein n=1 Tax=Roseibium sp. TaxID=1936156 RepID=UPI0026328F44|nr:DUF2207 domain-containing protein [Roseibium sp.]MCV0426697.1 DUF2207 domain-containing protein [Roseibium sp.]
MSIFRCAACTAAAFILVVISWSAQADERILKFVSNIDTARDGTLTVTETITVRAEAKQIRRGIFRDIPLSAKGASGRTYQVGFKLLSVLQDGQPAPHFTRRSADGIRIYVGEESVFLQPGNYTYTFVYETDRQIRFFDSHDEIYWNATGVEWAFPIDEVVARVVLPADVKASDWTGFTGGFGDTDQDFRTRSDENGSEVIFTTTKALAPHEGLTVVVNMPAGSIAQPTDAQQFQYFLSDYKYDLIGGAGALLVLIYYLYAWMRVGRDPAKGVIFPRFNPPAEISPALSRYIVNRGFGDGGWVALSAACLSLAVKKRLRLEDNDGEVTLHLEPEGRNGRAPGSELPKGEAVLEKWLNDRDSPLILNENNGKSIQALGSKFCGAILGESSNVFFKSNWTYLIPAVLLTIVTIAVMVALVFLTQSKAQQEFVIMFLFLSVFATFLSVGFGFIFFRLVSFPVRIVLTFIAFGLLMFGVASLANLATGGLDSMPAFPLSVAALIAMNVLFFGLIGAPTALGRQKLDEIEGLKLYLSVAEKDRLNMTEAPDMSTIHFEKLLPYAVALGVERPWAKAFEGWLATSAGAAEASRYHPGWYSGRTFDARHISDSVGATASAMAGSFQSSLPAPDTSSSGSSGGSSGGGGGGGGGGGW